MAANGTLLSSSGWGISIEWTDDEQRTLESCMMRFPADRFDPLQRYIRIATTLPRKSVRDVALRVRWTLLQQQLRKRTGLDVRKPGMPPMLPKPTMPMVPPLPGGAGMSPSFMPPAAGGSMQALEGPPTIEGPIAHLLDANLAILNHFRSNMSSFKVHENTQLLVQFRDNILQILHAMEAMGGTMAQMPQLPVRLNIDLANSFLPTRPAGVLTYDGMMMPPPPQPSVNAPGMVPMNSLNGLAPGGAGSHGAAGAAQTMHKPPPMGPPQMPHTGAPGGLPPRPPPPPHGSASGAGGNGLPPHALPPPPNPSAAAIMGDSAGADGQLVPGGPPQGHNNNNYSAGPGGTGDSFGDGDGMDSDNDNDNDNDNNVDDMGE